VQAAKEYFSFATELHATLTARQWLGDPCERQSSGLRDEEGCLTINSGFNNLVYWLSAFEKDLSLHLSVGQVSLSAREVNEYFSHLRSIVGNIDDLMLNADRRWIEAAGAFQALQLELISRATKDI
jgi:hypothetical protein